MPSHTLETSGSAQNAKAAILGKIAQARKAQGMTQFELARLVGVNRMTVQRNEQEDADPLLSNVLACAQVLGLSLAIQSPKEASELVHKGLAHNRTKHDLEWRDREREKVLAGSWEDANESRTFGPSPVLASLVPGSGQEAATACATVVQWLGSEIGFSFLTTALARAGYDVIDTRTNTSKRK